MIKLTITNSDNTKMSVDLIRYFRFKNDCFLIYSMGEVDEKNYKKLYLVRIMEELGFPVVQTIKNEADWSSMQSIVKKVLKELKKNKKSMTIDLNYHEIEGIKIVEPRFFKLDSSLVELLASNYSFDENTTSDSILSTKDDTLESIDQTMLRENNNYMTSGEEIDLKVTPNLETIQPVSPLPDYTSVDTVDENNINAIDNKIVQVKTNEDNVEVKLEPMVSLGEKTIINNTDNNNSISDNIASSDEPDYKKLYDSLKNDNIITNNLLNEVMSELSKYKEKYGELDTEV